MDPLLLRALLCPSEPFSGAIAGFIRAWRQGAAPEERPIDAAIRGGLLADRLGFAFAAGYRSALAALLPDGEKVASLCITEAEGGHPRAIRTRLEGGDRGWVLNGEKLWSTLAESGEFLAILASTGWEGDRNHLVLLRVPVGAPGLRLEPLPGLPFAPEIGHYRVEMVDIPVAVERVFLGDPYPRYVKPFRTVEDIFVAAATLAMLLGQGRAWPESFRLRLLGLLLVFRQLSQLPPDDPGLHLALAGAQAQLQDCLAAADWSALPEEVAARWHRDAPLLGVAGKARRLRLQRARELLWPAAAQPEGKAF
jgi:hypothetical protein